MTELDTYPSLQIFKSPLQSRVIRACYYQPSSGTMAIEMRAGGFRIWKDVPQSYVDALVHHRAPGLFYEKVMRHLLGSPLSPLGFSAILFKASIYRIPESLSASVSRVRRLSFQQ
ncbi:KTSC domain-containing protein [Rhizobium sp. 007]|uniref:KTSC domain-containing protein n=1 Tax=Rhizobium sp. 007 TaxID=2785056 RepID=UPI00188E8CA9|nr:KTSC domain-containing protein [Rhizobium sp. 007]QPB22388.1 KTSC domain-containing protein [Rhizobium sp. 007]